MIDQEGISAHWIAHPHGNSPQVQTPQAADARIDR
jgi:hypothetical protein